MNFFIAIPSYQRSTTLAEKTISYLRSTNVNLKNVFVFVADKKELEIYNKVKELKGIKLVVGKPTLNGQRNFMRHYFKQGNRVLFMDDDLEGVYTCTSKKHADLKLVTDLKSFAEYAFSLADRVKGTLWGIGPVLNPFFMFGKGVSTDLKYVVGCFYGEVINHDKKLDVTLEDKEDYERTILHFIKCGLVLRFNEYAPKTRYYKEQGGMQVTRTKQRVEASAKYLAKVYPRFCKLNTSKKNKEFVEIKLIKQ